MSDEEQERLRPQYAEAKREMVRAVDLAVYILALLSHKVGEK